MEVVAEPVISFIIEKTGDKLIQEAISLIGLHDQVQWIEEKLEWMQSLKDADAEQQGGERVKKLVQDVRDIAYDMEDVIDTFLLKIEPLRRGGFIGSVKRCAFIVSELIVRHKIDSKIKHIKLKIEDIPRRRATYGIESIGRVEGTRCAVRSLQERRLPSPNAQEADFVGFQKDLAALVGQLINEGELRRCVVSVVGMGGLGKTTLTQKLYNTESVKKHFHSRAWISVSQGYSVRDLLQAFVRRCMDLSDKELKKVEKMDAVELRGKIFEYLNYKRYLIVLDDIWTTEAWDDLKDAFPNMNNGSRVVLTTRNKEVALYAGSQPHELRFLNGDDSWELFCQKAFSGGDGRCPQNLEDLGRKIVEKCHHLPLAIVVIGGLLLTKEAWEWEKVYKRISRQLVERHQQISGILSLSYKDLPYYIKPCFLYLGNFPEDYEFHAKKLIRMWAAEGFLEERGEETLEEVGEDYLMQLIQRSMVQVTERSSSGGIKKCRIHDLLRDLSISESKEGMFLQVHSRINANAPPASRARRLAIHHNNSNNNISLSCSPPHLRSVLMYTQAYMWLQREEQKILYRRFQLLRVLCLDRVIIKKLPREIGELIHLRYLGCTETELKSLPSSIGNLPNLQTLLVESDYVNGIKVPSTIGKMQQLRHLQLKNNEEWWHRGGVIEGQPRLEQISNLQTLSNVEAGKWMEGCLGNLTNLRKLGIVLVTTADAEVFNDSIVKLGCLHSLSVTVRDGWLLVPRNSLLVKLRRSEQIETQEWSLPPFSNLLKLSKLYLKGKLEKLPESAQFPVNLTKLTLKHSGLEQDPLATLEKLEKLRILRLLKCSYVVKEMVCSSQGFPQLESLHLDGLFELEEWRVEKGAMPSLLHLYISQCYELKKLPEGLQHVTTLKKLELPRMHYEFVKRLDRGDGEDWHKIRHIPSIDIQDTLDYASDSDGEDAAPGAACAAEEEKKEEPAEESDDVATPVFAGEAAAPAAACAADEEKEEEPAEESDDD
ncbi:probable disease resistance RPP8-like protein 4 isoform X3 [Magnolia sinica]|uniref:probable disease resistance RPP8-like protein 4 isoform X3 n=1 Tax=Magnolia sinica TaxID=86752 RepID=UPI002658A7FA|nr:probable disease resistance RPP8-like protein 4 isoform X3 [Magnolia sinica]XP_058114464.1 probable disease resistance RPP8-like protein 4 isoform X4 [Magnolia sinica]XP_058114465.1 probable disease resistance RPP8-like protein 4 isoform X3 [Magnolia sinica]XP_058114466.1 probable disease resistance RPP8-like protein 4 isoform X3 [Magnolia sinica]XP_058114467.1 probable disease resistance RPP8-like protein 4 isoform X3 [Magnolia sinica]